MGKEIERQVHDGEIVEPDSTSNGVPANGRGQGDNNDVSVREHGLLGGWRAGRGEV